MAHFSRRNAILQEVVGHLCQASNLTDMLQTQDQQVQDKSIALEREGQKLEATNEIRSFSMGHVWSGKEYRFRE